MMGKAGKVNEFLKKTYPQVHCALDFANPLELQMLILKNL